MNVHHAQAEVQMPNRVSEARPIPGGLVPLIRKDLYLHRRLSGGALALGIVTLALLAGGGAARFHMGSVLMVTVLVGLGATLAIHTVVEERQHQTLPFIMSLPVSMKQYATAKIVANVLIFGSVWTMLLLGSLTIILSRGDLPDGLTAYAIIVLTEIAVSNCLILAVAMATQSLAWTLGIMVCGNLIFNGFVFGMFRNPAFAAAAESPDIVWPPEAQSLFFAEIVGIVLLLGIAYVVSIRRRDVL